MADELKHKWFGWRRGRGIEWCCHCGCLKVYTQIPGEPKQGIDYFVGGVEPFSNPPEGGFRKEPLCKHWKVMVLEAEVEALEKRLADPDLVLRDPNYENNYDA